MTLTVPPPMTTRPWAILDFCAPEVSVFGQLVNQTNTGPASGFFGTANTAVAIPFMLRSNLTILKLGWINGAAAGNNHCIAIYDASYARLVTTGSTLGSGNNTLQWVDTADTALVRDTLYWVAYNHESITVDRCTTYGGMQFGTCALSGMLQQAVGAIALPDPLVPVALTQARAFPAPYALVTAGLG